MQIFLADILCETNAETLMKTQDVIEYFGSVANAADALGMTHQAIYAWKEEVPKTRQAHVEMATKGRIKKDKPQKIKADQ